MKPEMLEALESGATILTANRRLARFIKTQFDEAQRSRGRVVWRSPDILPWTSWLERCWETLSIQMADAGTPPVVLLSAIQEQSLWESIIADYVQAGDRLLQVPATARNAASAWRLMQVWHLDLPTDKSLLSADVQVFNGWSEQYAVACSKQGWMDQARLPVLVESGCRAGHVALPARLYLAGFDELTPQQRQLLATLEAKGCPCAMLEPEEMNTDAVRTCFADAEAEVSAVASWVHDLLENHPGESVGIVVPDLNALKGTITRIFDDILQPQRVVPDAVENIARPYNMSLGSGLIEFPVIHAALLGLGLIAGKLSLEKTGSLLRSAFIAGAETEMAGRSLLDAKLRNIGELEVSLSTLLSLAKSRNADALPRPYSSPILAEYIEKIAPLLAQVKRLKQRPSAWSSQFKLVLNELGWPGERVLSSEECQAAGAWRDVLTEFASLDVVLSDISYDNAFQYLRRMTAEAMFQPETEQVPVQILGTLEAANMSFDHAWIMGVHDEAWPSAAHPNPFLPLNLQRNLGVPHSSAARELAFAQHITTRMRASAPHVIFSYPERAGDRALRPSPLIHDLPEVDAAALVVAADPGYARLIHSASDLEQIEDNQAPVIQENGLTRGGTGLFKQQAACPFRAFGEYRLGAVTLDEGRVGLSPAERGTLLHRSLELAWDEIKSHAQLCEATDAEMSGLISQAVKAAVGEMASIRLGTFTPRFTELECNRLAHLLAQWLLIEKQRAPFVVLASERQQAVTMGGISVNAKIDRMDVLEDGTQVIIDYKTNLPNVKHWFGDRPEEPQLPLYCAASGQNVKSVFFAQIRLGDMAFKGLSASEGVAAGIAAFAETDIGKEFGTWEQMLVSWKSVLDRLGEDFKQGKAAVDPKRFPKTCAYCDLGPLCRISELSNIGLLDEEAVDEPDQQ